MSPSGDGVPWPIVALIALACAGGGPPALAALSGGGALPLLAALLAATNLALVCATVWAQARRKVKYYDSTLALLEEEQGEWHVHYVLERELARVLKYYGRYGGAAGSPAAGSASSDEESSGGGGGDSGGDSDSDSVGESSDESGDEPGRVPRRRGGSGSRSGGRKRTRGGAASLPPGFAFAEPARPGLLDGAAGFFVFAPSAAAAYVAPGRLA